MKSIQNVFYMIFKKVELQILNYCNRECAWCPMFTTYRPSKVIRMSEDVFENIIRLIDRNIHPKADITVSRYCEPLMDLELLYKYTKRLKGVFENKVCIHTNGDLFTSETLRYLEYIDDVIVNLYDKDIDEALSFISSIFEDNKIIDFNMSFDNKGISFSYDSKNIKVYYNRAETLKIKTRGGALNGEFNYIENNKCYKENRCDIVGSIIAFDYNGEIFPCCDTHGSIDSHNSLCVGSVYDNIDEIEKKIKSIDSRKIKTCHTCEASYKELIGGL